MKRTLTVAVVLAILGMLPLAAQQKPDFSGEWILNRQASTLSPGADAIQSGVLRVEHREPTFRSNAEFVSAGGLLRAAEP